MLGRALFAPGGALTDQRVWNSREMHAAEVPAANGIGDARSLARMYAACVGEVDGVRLLTTEQVKRATTQQTTGPNKILMDMDIQFGLGFMLPSTLMTLGGPTGFGHFGAGGSVGWADLDAEFGFGYVDEPHGHGARRRPAELQPHQRLLRVGQLGVRRS